jgi:hypothetical protein
MSNQRDYYRNSKDPEQKKSGFLSILVRYVIPYLIINSIILFFVLATPKLKVNEITETEDPTVRTLLVHVDSILPIKEFTAKLEGKEQNFTKENQNYIISITGNGNLRISAKSINGMMQVSNTQVNSFDENPPVIDEDNVILGSGYVEFTVTDEQSGVDFATIYGIDKDGDNLKPTDIEESSGKVTFSMKSNGLTVYVSDKAGNQITGNFTLEESPFPKTKEDEKEDEKEDNKESSSHSSSKNSSSSKDEEESSSSKSSSKNTSSQSSGKSSSRKSSSQTSTNSGSGKSKSN